MDDIADDVELSKAALYRYFKNKASLYFSVVVKGMVLLRDTFKDAIIKEKTGLSKIRGIVRAFHNYIQNYSDYYRLNISSRDPRFSNMLQSTDGSEVKIENAEKYITLTKDLFDMIRRAVKLGIKDGTMRKELDTIKTVMFLSSAIEATVQISPVNQLLLEMFNITPEEYLQHSIDLLMHGLASEKLDL